MKKLRVFGALALALVLVTGCGSSKEANNKIVIGVSPSPHEQIIKNLDKEFKDAGLDVEVKVFSDYVQPNIALNDGDLDLNYFQHIPYLENFNKEYKFDLVSLGGIHLEPLGAYSTKIKNISELKDGDEVLIPNDSTNAARALVLLEDNNLIKLKNKGDINSTEKDIVENPKNLKITAMDAGAISSAYQDAALGVINSNYAIAAEIDPKSALIQEKVENNPYANVVAVKKEHKDDEKIKKFIEILKSKKTKDFIDSNYNGEIIAAFN